MVTCRAGLFGRSDMASIIGNDDETPDFIRFCVVDPPHGFQRSSRNLFRGPPALPFRADRARSYHLARPEAKSARGITARSFAVDERRDRLFIANNLS